jgi:hypothetical protein
MLPRLGFHRVSRALVVKRRLHGQVRPNLPLTPALLRLDPMFDPLRNGSALPKTLRREEAVTVRVAANRQPRSSRKRVYFSAQLLRL